jgi:hypothetical protein
LIYTKITFTVFFDVNGTSYTSTVNGVIASISPQSQTVRKITFVGGTMSTTTIFTPYTLGDPITYDDFSNSLVILDPFLNNTSGFDYSSFNPLIDNAVIARPNFDYFDVDFSSNAITAVNRNTILTASRGSGSATPSTTPASNYTIARSANPRYNGSRTSSPTGSRYQSFVNQPMNSGSSIGNVANVENYCDWFAYFDNISPSFLAYELYIGGSQVSSITIASAVHVTTLIDINGNTIDLNPTNNIIPSSSLFGILDNKVNRIVITRPVVESGEKIGYLPGTAEEKLHPYLLPLLDEVRHFISNAEFASLKTNNNIEIVPLGLMRGRNFHNAFIVADECQNASYDQLKMLLTFEFRTYLHEFY